MIAIQVGLIVFLVVVLAVVYLDERKRRILSRKSAKLKRFWHPNKERRRSVRINTAVDVSYEVVSNEAAKKHNSLSRNISLGGINLALNERLPVGDTLKLQLNIPGNPRAITAQGKIVWVKEISSRFIRDKNQRFFAAGIQFTKMESGAEAILRKFINQRTKDVPEQERKEI